MSREAADQPPHLLTDGQPRHPTRINSATWRDPDDSVALERDSRGRAHQRTIKGYRVSDPLDRLPCDASQIKASARLRDDWERGSGARTGTSDAGRVDSASRDHDSTAGQLEARRRYETATQAVGPRGCIYLLPVVLSGWTVTDLVLKYGGNAMSMQGRVLAALDRLADHYFPPKTQVLTAVSPLLDAICPRCRDEKTIELVCDDGITIETRNCPLCSLGRGAVLERIGRKSG